VASDWYVERGMERLAQINAERAQAVADLEAARARYDDDGAGEAIQRVADLDAAAASINNLYYRYAASQTPPPQRVLTPEERAAKPISAMNWDDLVDMVRTSKYAKDISPSDENMIAGYYEAQRRRARGE
jgi:hypothetical protein